MPNILVTLLYICWRETSDINRFPVTQERFLAVRHCVLFKLFLIHPLLVIKVPYLRQKCWRGMFYEKLLWILSSDTRSATQKNETFSIMLSNADEA